MSIGDYQLERVLGRGGFGEVHLAWRRSDYAQVAIKVLRLPDNENLPRFYREATLLYQQHGNPHVVNLLDSDFSSEPVHIVMEYCRGGSLRSWVGKQLPWLDVARALAHAAAGLAGIHQRGGFHRDIKPDNLLIQLDDHGKRTIKVGDFGLGRAPDTSSSTAMTHSPAGTRGYMAPELEFGSPYDSRCDIYSLGVTGIELLTGSRTPSLLIGRLDIPHALRRLLLSMVDYDPAKRPTIQGCQAALTAVINPRPLPAIPRQAVPAVPVQAQAPAGNGAAAAGIFGGIAALALLALGTMNTKDANGRFHGSDGRFRSGRWG